MDIGLEARNRWGTAEDPSAAGSASDLCVFRRIQEERAVQPGHSNLGVRAGLRMHCRDVEGQEAKSQSRAESIPRDLSFLVILQIGCVNGRKPYKKGCVNGEGVDRIRARFDRRKSVKGQE